MTFTFYFILSFLCGFLLLLRVIRILVLRFVLGLFLHSISLLFYSIFIALYCTPINAISLILYFQINQFIKIDLVLYNA